MRTNKPTRKRKPLTRGKSQRDKFIETARALGCDESDASYERLVKKLGAQPPQSRRPKKKGKRNG